MINNPLGMSIDVDALRPTLAAGTGGLSGPAILPLAVRCVWQVHAAIPGVPIVGVGGVTSGHDALQLILAGACVVGVGTALFHDPYACLRIERELEELLQAKGFHRLADAVGLAHRPTARHLLVDSEESSL
jgi:dihydroorotate dehydrogenase (NAD+) catalytic subunit